MALSKKDRKHILILFEALLKTLEEGAERKETINKARRTGEVPKRKPSAYQTAYGRNFKKVAPKYKKANGSWKKDGFKKAQKEAHKLTRKGRK